MKNTKRTVALFLAAAMMLSIAGCANNGENTNGSTAESVSLSTIESADQEEALMTEVPAETDEDYVPSDAEIAYDAYNAFVDSFAGDYEGEIYFGYEYSYEDGHAHWKLHVSYPDTDMTEIYDAIDGEVTYIGTLDYYDDQALPYDVFRALPCMIQVNADSARNSVNNPADGRFFGDIEAAAIDGSYLLLNIGDPLIISEEEYNSLNVGDVIDTPVFGDGQQGMTVTAIDESNGYRTVELDGRDDYWFVQHPYSEDDPDYILETYSDNPVLFNYRLCPVPLASDCEVTDQYAALFSDSDTEAFNNWNPGPDANALTSSSYWFYENVNTTDVPEPVHGWIPANGLAYPLTIENGELTSINIEWR